MTEPVALAMQLFLTTLDFIGTFVFALSGAVAAAKRGLDVFGILVLSIVAATTGGLGSLYLGWHLPNVTASKSASTDRNSK